MDDHEQHTPEQSPQAILPTAAHQARWLTLPLNAVIAIALVVAGYFTYTLVARNAGETSQPVQAQAKTPRVLQLDVLNGCGAKGAASKFTTFLRNRGFDVVEMKNYKVSTMAKTLVVDRVGDMRAARRVAEALDVSDKNIVQQLNPDYFVDVSVIIGADYMTLEPSHH